MKMKQVTASPNIEALEELFLQDFHAAVESLSKVICEGSNCEQNKGVEYASNVLINRLILKFDTDPPDSVRSFLNSQLTGLQIDEKKISPIMSDFLFHYTYTHKEYLYSDATPQVDPSILGRIYEQYLSGEERERKGVYFTSKVEIELMCKTVLLNCLKNRTNISYQKLVILLFDPTLRKLGERDCQGRCPLDRSESQELLTTLDSLKILDPACGSGAFLLGIFHQICLVKQIISNIFTGMPPASLNSLTNLRMLYGMDVNPLALWITKIRLWIAFLNFLDFERASNAEEIGTILDKHIIPGDCLTFSAEIIDTGFDIVIGNPPYVQHTRISPPTIQSPTKHQKLEYIQQIQEVVRQDWGKKMSFHGQADYYVYFFLRGLKFLRNNGFLCYITSSTWLDGELGIDLRAFLVDYTKIVQFIDTLVQKSFSQANINTIITVLQKIPQITNPLDNLVKFCLFKIPLMDTMNPEIFTTLAEVHETKDLEWGQITVIQQGTLGSPIENGPDERLNSLQNRWGTQFLKYYGPIMQVLNSDTIRKKFVPLSQLATLKRGFTSGANGFFYLDKWQATTSQVEKVFLIPLLKSPKELEKIAIDTPDKFENFVFFCRDSKHSLVRTNALRYIENYGEQTEVTIKGKTVVGFHNTETCRARDPWYALPYHDPAPIIIQKGFSETFTVFQNVSKILVDQTFYEIVPKEQVTAEYLLAVMNSTLGIFELLRISTSGLGGGLYRPTVNELRTLSLPDITRLPSLVIPEAMKQRRIGTIFEECGLDPHRELSTQDPHPQPDRQLLDETLFDHLGINRKWLPELYRVACGLVRVRLLKAVKL